ncbi:MAG: ATP-binding cassette domain-containing protein [Clostridium sp.]|nr:ATP-binding cassette domain-containing protein [Clostridium sp.]
MLKLKNIYKIYKSGDLTQTALDGIDLTFRESEFVAILGQSGSGKTTMLNIIGGLDKYDKGDLIINGKSTKEYTDRDWDTYRNHSIGFVFQSYNLIPHQTVLSNVELALTLSGVSKEERRKRAEEVLDKVGLRDQSHKKPNQMSGGQMQRVAIARALINDPDILLADEPTGALDTETSIQIMELLKEISRDRLIIMVTHNPDLAKEYANRIISLRDGKIIDDTNPLNEELKEVSKDKREEKMKKTSMSFITALSLSLNNLKTKKGRTIMTSFAGSIGIIGIALILSLSSGLKAYISKVQEDTLLSYPITIESQGIDIASMISSMMEAEKDKGTGEDGKIYSNNIMTDMITMTSAQVSKNDLRTFKEFLSSDKSMISEYANVIQYGYDLNLQVYSSDTKEGVTKINPSNVLEKMGFGMAINSASPISSVMSSRFEVWRELLDNKTLMESEYDVIAGTWPQNYNEVVLIVDKNNEISDMALYSLGLLDPDEIDEAMKKLSAGEEIEQKTEVDSFTYEEILNSTYKLVLNTDYYEKNGDIWTNKSENEMYMQKIIKDGMEIKIVGIIKPSEDSILAEENGSIGYTSDLTKFVVDKINSSDVVKQQKANTNIDIFTGLPFEVNEEEKEGNFDISLLTEEEKSYIAALSKEQLQALMAQYKTESDSTYAENLSKLGVVDLERPSIINIYAKDFESKEAIADIISKYNKEKTEANEEEYVVHYTDYVGLIMSSFTRIIDIVSYVLIAFVAISLVVSSIMIGIITYISVLERTKEIGILRSIGASKRDVSRVFNAETLIIGFSAGALGVVVTILLNYPINAIIKAISGVSGVAKLPIAGMAILVIISMGLTVIAGIFPSRMAAKKDPVEALRTE